MPDIPKLLDDGDQHQLRGQLEEAARIHQKILRAAPGRRCARPARHGARSTARQQEAIEIYDKAIRFKPHSPQAHYNRGLALTKLGRYPEAAPSFARAVELRPELPEALGEYARALRTNCDWSRHDWLERQLAEMPCAAAAPDKSADAAAIFRRPRRLARCCARLCRPSPGAGAGAAAPAASPGRRENSARLSLRRFPRARGRLSHRAADRAPRPRPLRGHRHFHWPGRQERPAPPLRSRLRPLHRLLRRHRRGSHRADTSGQHRRAHRLDGIHYAPSP